MWAGGGTQAQGEAEGQTEWTTGQGDGAGKGDGLVLGTLYGDASEAWGWELGPRRSLVPSLALPTPRPSQTYGAVGACAALLLPNRESGGVSVLSGRAVLSVLHHPSPEAARGPFSRHWGQTPMKPWVGRAPDCLGLAPNGAGPCIRPLHPQTRQAPQDGSPGPRFSVPLPAPDCEVTQAGSHPGSPEPQCPENSQSSRQGGGPGGLPAPPTSQGQWQPHPLMGSRFLPQPQASLEVRPCGLELPGEPGPRWRPWPTPGWHHEGRKTLRHLLGAGRPTSGGLPRCWDRTTRLISVSGWLLSWQQRGRAGSASPGHSPNSGLGLRDAACPVTGWLARWRPRSLPFCLPTPAAFPRGLVLPEQARLTRRLRLLQFPRGIFIYHKS